METKRKTIRIPNTGAWLSQIVMDAMGYGGAEWRRYKMQGIIRLVTRDGTSKPEVCSRARDEDLWVMTGTTVYIGRSIEIEVLGEIMEGTAKWTTGKDKDQAVVSTEERDKLLRDYWNHARYVSRVQELSRESIKRMLDKSEKLNEAIINTVYPAIRLMADGSWYIDKDGNAHVGYNPPKTAMIMYSHNWKSSEKWDDFRKAEVALTEDVRIYIRNNIEQLADAREIAHIVKLMA